MKKLLKDYGLNSHVQYYEMIVDSIINGQRTQAKELFSAMPKHNRKDCIVWLLHVTDDSSLHVHGLNTQDVYMLIHLI